MEPLDLFCEVVVLKLRTGVAAGGVRAQRPARAGSRGTIRGTPRVRVQVKGSGFSVYPELEFRLRVQVSASAQNKSSGQGFRFQRLESRIYVAGFKIQRLGFSSGCRVYRVLCRKSLLEPGVERGCLLQPHRFSI